MRALLFYTAKIRPLCAKFLNWKGREFRFSLSTQASIMQAVKPQSHMGGSAYSSRERRLKCMYTTQLTKKRKTWSDGMLKVFFSGGSFQCSLLDAGKLRETVLASRQLESLEVQQLKKNEEIELDFEGYLVTVSAGTSEHDVLKVGPPLKLPKFVPPSRYVPPSRQADMYGNGSNNPVAAVSNRVRSVCVSGPYKVSNDELDDIWDRDQPPQAPQAAQNVQFGRGVEPPAFLAYSKERADPSNPSARFGHQNTHVRPPPAAPRSSIDATLRLTGNNAGGDASQPALTRYFAAAPQARQPEHLPPRARPHPEPDHAAPALAPANTKHGHTNYDTNPVMSGYNANGARSDSTGAPPVSSNSRDPTSNHHVQRQPAANNQSYRESGTQNAASSFRHATSAPAPAFPLNPSLPKAGLDGTNVVHSMNSFAPEAPVQVRPPAGASVGGSANTGVRGDVDGAQSTVKTSYSSIISSSVWDSD